MKLSRSIRIDPRSSEYLNRTRGKPGEILFDQETNSVRCYDGKSIGGFELAKSDLSNISVGELSTLTSNLNLVSTLAVYNDPPWIASLNGNKIAGRINGVVYVNDSGVVSNNMLTNSTVRFGNTTVSLGGNSSSIVGLTSVSSTTFTGALSGNATTATRLRTARSINGVLFDGTQDIVISGDGEVSVSVNADELQGNTLASNVVSSSLTSVGTLATLNVSSTISTAGNIAATGSVTSSNAVVNNSVTVGNNATINNNVTVGGAVTATGNITTSSFVVSSKTPVNKTHLTNKKYVDTRSISMSVALS